MRKEQEVNAALLTSQAQQVPVALGSHTPCYDEHGQELDYHEDVPAAMDSQECRSWSEYFRQQGDASGVQIADSVDEEHRLLLGPTMTSTVSEEAVLLREEGNAYRGHEAVFSGTRNPHARDVERTLYMHRTLAPAGGPIGVH